ncbi:MAG: class I SAM-dependent methyltransferase [Caldilineaceae bacterium]
MTEGRPSFTAITAAVMRAAHLLLDQEPLLLRDDLALPLSGVGDEMGLQAALAAFRADAMRRLGAELAEAVFHALRGLMVMRSRYTEDALAEARQRGVAQYVMLGAGLDSFVYRRRDLIDQLHVFEVDHPATQRWKRSRLATLAVDTPANLTFVPIDFETQSLMACLGAHGYRAAAPAFFSWLGVTQYLTAAAMTQMLRDVAIAANGSELVFEYSVTAANLDEMARRILHFACESNAARGEPWLTLFTPAALAAQVQALGFAVVRDVGSAEAFDRYFAQRSDGLRSVPTTHLMHVCLS